MQQLESKMGFKSEHENAIQIYNKQLNNNFWRLVICCASVKGMINQFCLLVYLHVHACLYIFVCLCVYVLVCVWMCACMFVWAIWTQDSGIDIGDVSERKALRKRLQCKTFRWYLVNMYPEMRMYSDTIAYGVVSSLPTSTFSLILFIVWLQKPEQG